MYNIDLQTVQAPTGPRLQGGAAATSLQLWHTAHDKLLIMVEVLHTILASLASCLLPPITDSGPR